MPDAAVSTTIDAPPEKVWDLVSDLPRMGEWSPENTGGRWVGGAKGPKVGARFVGTNKKGIARWATVCKVVEADRGKSFVFDVSAGLFKVARWAYRITPEGDGACSLTEEFTDRRNKLSSRVTGAVLRVPDRAEHNRKGMEQTLQRVKAAAERG
jgi:uncharacterized protein YndB with AHSA1/START domain